MTAIALEKRNKQTNMIFFTFQFYCLFKNKQTNKESHLSHFNIKIQLRVTELPPTSCTQHIFENQDLQL